jgi:hypothetical protein
MRDDYQDPSIEVVETVLAATFAVAAEQVRDPARHETPVPLTRPGPAPPLPQAGKLAFGMVKSTTAFYDNSVIVHHSNLPLVIRWVRGPHAPPSLPPR